MDQHQEPGGSEAERDLSMELAGFQAEERDLSMELREEERQLALSIKNAVESSDYIKPMSDFEYAYLAICCMGKTLDHILGVAYKIQCFRELYKLNGTPTEGKALIGGFMELQPGFLLDVSYLPSEQCFTLVGDLAAARPERVKTDAQWRAFQGGNYHILRATTTDFRSIRNGIVCLTECEGMGVHNFDYASKEREMAELWSYWPLKIKENVWLNTPTVANFIYALAKRSCSKEFSDTFKMGGGIAGYEGRLDSLFNMPTLKIAQQHLLTRIEIYLFIRQRNEQTFSLTR